MDMGPSRQIIKLRETLHSIFFPKEKELRTIWKVEKDGKMGFLAGTAHFFPYRLRKSLKSYIQDARIVLFEGPLDKKSMNEVIEKGSKEEGATALYEALDPQTIKKIKKCMGQFPHESGSLPLILPLTLKVQDPLYFHFQSLRPWMAFFEIWSHFLKERGWKYSVDLEALEIATQLKKEIFFLESIEEQIAALEGIPFERFVNFFKKIDLWEEFAKAHVQLYLRGELEAIMGATKEFPSRCPSIVEKRDAVMFERMKPFFEKGEVVAFIGTPHILGIKKMFLEEGYESDQVW
jgi:hypothetical protein